MLRNPHRKPLPTLTPVEITYRKELITWEELASRGINLPAPKPPPPIIVPKPRPPGAHIGYDLKTGDDVYLSAENLIGGLLLLGKNGTGKTVTIEHLTVHAMQEGRCVLVLDPHGDLTNRLLLRVPPHRTHDVVLLNIAHPTHAFGINPFWCPTPHDEAVVAQLGDEVHDIFKKIWADSWGALLDDLIPNAAYTLLANPGYSMVELPRVFTDDAFRAKLLRNVPDVIRDFWEQEYDIRSEAGQRTLIRSTLSRVRKFLRNPLFRQVLGQQFPTIDFARFMAEKKIVLVKMSVQDLGDDNVSLLGSLLVRQILAAAFDRLNLPIGERHLVMFFADEYQRFATRDFGTLLQEARKTGLTPILAHQNRDQLDADLRQAPLGARNTICLQVSAKDAHDIVEELDATPPKPAQPVSDPLTHIKRRGHPNPQVLSLVHDLEESLEFALARAVAFDRRYGGASPQRIHAIKTRITNTSTRMLLAAMRQQNFEAERLTKDLNHALSLLIDSKDWEDSYTLTLSFLCSYLKSEPLYDPRDQLSRSQMKDELRTTLTHLEPLQAYSKLQDGTQIVERLIQIALPPSIDRTPELEAQQRQIDEQFCEHYGRPRLDVEHEIRKRRNHALSHDGYTDDTDGTEGDEELSSVLRWEEVSPSENGYHKA